MAPRTPNYRQARSDRNLAKEQKKQERLRRREGDALQRKADREGNSDEPSQSDQTDEPVPPAHDR